MKQNNWLKRQHDPSGHSFIRTSRFIASAHVSFVVEGTTRLVFRVSRIKRGSYRCTNQEAEEDSQLLVS